MIFEERVPFFFFRVCTQPIWGHLAHDTGVDRVSHLLISTDIWRYCIETWEQLQRLNTPTKLAEHYCNLHVGTYALLQIHPKSGLPARGICCRPGSQEETRFERSCEGLYTCLYTAECSTGLWVPLPALQQPRVLLLVAASRGFGDTCIREINEVARDFQESCKNEIPGKFQIVFFSSQRTALRTIHILHSGCPSFAHPTCDHSSLFPYIRHPPSPIGVT